MKKSPTAWQNVGRWYNRVVGEQGHYYHQSIIIPGVLKLLQLPQQTSTHLLDLACGQGVLSRHLPVTTSYVGVDAANDLIKLAHSYQQHKNHRFIHADVTQPLALNQAYFSHATLILALQNIEHPVKVFKNAYQHLQPGGMFVIVINHPCFRIPRQSSWHVDLENKIQYRRIDRYMSPMKIPIQAHPSQGNQSTQTWSFHHSLSDYSHYLKEAGFAIDTINEWCSDKESEGKAAKMENRSREEIPLFLTIAAIKK